MKKVKTVKLINTHIHLPLNWDRVGQWVGEMTYISQNTRQNINISQLNFRYNNFLKKPNCPHIFEYKNKNVGKYMTPSPKLS